MTTEAGCRFNLPAPQPAGNPICSAPWPASHVGSINHVGPVGRLPRSEKYERNSPRVRRCGHLYHLSGRGRSPVCTEQGPREISRLLPRMLLDIQNRGQLAAGITSFDPDHANLLKTRRDVEQ